MVNIGGVFPSKKNVATTQVDVLSEEPVLLKKEQFKRCIDGVVIPRAYTRISERKARRLERAGHASEVRVYREKYFYRFDPQEPSYQRLVAQARQDTKELEKALHRVVKEEDLPIWVKQRGRPNAKKDHFAVQFPIATPFLSSLEEKHEGNRMQQREGRSVLMLHFDETNWLESVRYWSTPGSAEELRFREAMHITLTDLCDEVSGFYGNWEKLAKLLLQETQVALAQSRGG